MPGSYHARPVKTEGNVNKDYEDRKSARARLRFMEQHEFIKDWDFTEGEDKFFVLLLNDIEIEMTSIEVFHFFLGGISSARINMTDKRNFLTTSLRRLKIVPPAEEDEYIDDAVNH